MTENIHDGTTGPVEGLILLSLLDGLEGANLDKELLEANTQGYPQYETVWCAIDRRLPCCPMCVLVDSFVIDDLLSFYVKRSISLDELVYRLAILGRTPDSTYLGMSPKEGRALGTNTDFIRVFLTRKYVRNVKHLNNRKQS